MDGLAKRAERKRSGIGKKIFQITLWPLARVILGWWVSKKNDPWEPLDYSVPFHKVAEASEHDFSWYFQGECSVSPTSLDALCDWLRACEYVRDEEQFERVDHWLHPQEFERLRKGDCEDHSLWAWRKLVEMGSNARFYVGRLDDGSPERVGNHSWVVIDYKESRFLLESTAKEQAAMIVELADVSHLYTPYFSVDASFKPRPYIGFLHDAVQN